MSQSKRPMPPTAKPSPDSDSDDDEPVAKRACTDDSDDDADDEPTVEIELPAETYARSVVKDVIRDALIRATPDFRLSSHGRVERPMTGRCYSNAASNVRWATGKMQCENKKAMSHSDGMGRPVCVTTVSDCTFVEYNDTYTAAAAVGVDASTIGYRCKREMTVGGKRFTYAAQPDLVRVAASTGVAAGGRVTLKLSVDVERWRPVYAEDWVEGGKYFRTCGKKYGKRLVSGKRKRDDASSSSSGDHSVIVTTV